MFACPEKVGEKLVSVFIVNTEKTVNRNKIIAIYSDFAFACLINSRIIILIIYLQVYVKNYYSYTQTIYFQRVNNICYFNLIKCCKTSKEGTDLEEPII